MPLQLHQLRHALLVFLSRRFERFARHAERMGTFRQNGVQIRQMRFSPPEIILKLLLCEVELPVLLAQSIDRGFVTGDFDFQR
jgi:hypothetical protein